MPNLITWTILVFSISPIYAAPAFETLLGSTSESASVDLEGRFWRGERGRTPKDIEKAGGFSSHGLDVMMGKAKLANKDNVKDQYIAGCSLFEHAKALNRPSDQYVSVSESPMIAHRFAIGELGRSEGPYYLYRVFPGELAIDVNASLKDKSPFKDQKEHAVAGHIPFDRIEGWYEIPGPSRGVIYTGQEWADKQKAKPKGGALLRIKDGVKFHENKKFKKDYYHEKPGGAHPELAGIDEKSRDPSLAQKFASFFAEAAPQDKATKVYNKIFMDDKDKKKSFLSGGGLW
ncbi:hypothetical protein H072_8075 [Dactylellina haptotyla CBS 200.50]|uniref:Enterotoxin n=1 Tax=Dactylellina haptotyla (strain CBS 200.50) TaxID=1284197 RepID=S8A685_DACHA|nr:hypothetical protein H072_8075 [Dactylellina haptotyla CBS 200.50]